MLNRVVLVGRLTKDIELRYTPNGIAVANFTLAVNRPFKKDGEQQADFINIQVWRAPAENAANYLSKGSLCGIDGKIQTRNYEGSDGKRVYVTEVVADSVQFLEPKKDSKQSNHQSTTQSNNQQNTDPFDSGQPVDIDTDDLPF